MSGSNSIFKAKNQMHPLPSVPSVLETQKNQQPWITTPGLIKGKNRQNYFPLFSLSSLA